MLNHHTGHAHYLPLLKNQLNELYIVHCMEGFVFALIGIFIPIYLLTLGYTIPQVLVFYIIEKASIIAFTFLVGHLSGRFGLKHTMIMRVPFLMLFLFMLYQLDSIAIPLSIIAIVDGLQIALYWIPLHCLFARSSKDDHMGTEVSMLVSFPKIASIIAPIMGGFITVFFGFGTLFITAMALLAISMIPLFRTPDMKPHCGFRMKESIKIFRKYPKFFIGVGVTSVDGIVEGIIWPIFVFITLRNILSVGLIGTLVAAGAAIFTLVIGKLSDRFDKRIIIRAGAVLLVLVWFSRHFAHAAAPIYVLTVLAGFFAVLVGVPFSSITYAIAKKNNIDEFIIFREIPIALSRIMILSLAFLLVTRLEVTFIMAGIANIFFMFF